jgi:hypothetical protein
MELWQLDIMGGIWLTDGRELKAVTGIDDHSRFCVAAGLIERATARSVCRIFTQALARYGTPEELLTDNGKVFPGRLGPTPARSCSTASAANTAAPTGAPGSAARPPPARSNGSTRRCGPSCSRADGSTRSPRRSKCWMPGLTTTPPSVRTRPSPWPSRPGASSRRPPRRLRSQPSSPVSRSRWARPSHPADIGQRPARGLLPAGLSRPAPRRPNRHRPAPPQHPAGVLRRPAQPHRATPQHQGGGPTPRPPTPPAETTTYNHLRTCQPSPGTKPESINRN